MLKFIEQTNARVVEQNIISTGIIPQVNPDTPVEEELYIEKKEEIKDEVCDLLQSSDELSFPKFIIPSFEKKEGIILSEKEQTDNFKEGHFNYLLIGPPGAGKSTLLMNFVNHPSLYYKKFHRILFITQSNIIGLEEFQSPKNTISTVDPLWIESKLMEINKQAKLVPSMNVLIIFDDVISELKEQLPRNLFLRSLIKNRRHMLAQHGIISLIFTGQKYLDVVPPLIRNTMTGVFLFKPSLSDALAINKEFWGFTPKKLCSFLRLIFTSSYLKEKFGKMVFLFWKRDDNSFFVNFNPLKLTTCAFI